MSTATAAALSVTAVLSLFLAAFIFRRRLIRVRLLRASRIVSRFPISWPNYNKSISQSSNARNNSTRNNSRYNNNNSSSSNSNRNASNQVGRTIGNGTGSNCNVVSDPCSVLSGFCGSDSVDISAGTPHSFSFRCPLCRVCGYPRSDLPALCSFYGKGNLGDTRADSDARGGMPENSEGVGESSATRDAGVSDRPGSLGDAFLSLLWAKNVPGGPLSQCGRCGARGDPVPPEVASILRETRLADLRKAKGKSKATHVRRISSSNNGNNNNGNNNGNSSSSSSSSSGAGAGRRRGGRRRNRDGSDGSAESVSDSVSGDSNAVGTGTRRSSRRRPKSSSNISNSSNTDLNGGHALSLDAGAWELNHGVPGGAPFEATLDVDNDLGRVSFPKARRSHPFNVVSSTAIGPGVSVSFTVVEASSNEVFSFGLCGRPFPPFAHPGDFPVSCGLRSDTGRVHSCANGAVARLGNTRIKFGAGDTITLSVTLDTTDVRTPSATLHVRRDCHPISSALAGGATPPTSTLGSASTSVPISSLHFSSHPLFPCASASGGAVIAVRCIDAPLTRAVALDFERAFRPLRWSQYSEPPGTALTFGVDGVHPDIELSRPSHIDFRRVSAAEERSVACNRALTPGHGCRFSVTPKGGGVAMVGLTSRPYPRGRLPGYQQNSVAVRSDNGKLVLHLRPNHEGAGGAGAAEVEPVTMDYMPGGFGKGDDIEIFVTRASAPGSPALLVMYKNRNRLPPIDISVLGYADSPLFPCVGATRHCKVQYQPLETASCARRTRRETSAMGATLTWFDYRKAASHRFIAVPDDVTVTDASRRVLFRRPANPVARCIFSQRALAPNMRFRCRVDSVAEGGFLVVGLCTLPYPNYACPGQNCHSVGLVSGSGRVLLGTGKPHDKYGSGYEAFPGGFFGAGDELEISVDLSGTRAYAVIVLNSASEARVDITELNPGLLLLFPAIACSTEADIRVLVEDASAEREAFPRFEARARAFLPAAPAAAPVAAPEAEAEAADADSRVADVAALDADGSNGNGNGNGNGVGDDDAGSRGGDDGTDDPEGGDPASSAMAAHARMDSPRPSSSGPVGREVHSVVAAAEAAMGLGAGRASSAASSGRRSSGARSSSGPRRGGSSSSSSSSSSAAGSASASSRSSSSASASSSSSSASAMAPPPRRSSLPSSRRSSSPPRAVRRSRAPSSQSSSSPSRSSSPSPSPRTPARAPATATPPIRPRAAAHPRLALGSGSVAPSPRSSPSSSPRRSRSRSSSDSSSSSSTSPRRRGRIASPAAVSVSAVSLPGVSDFEHDVITGRSSSTAALGAAAEAPSLVPSSTSSVRRGKEPRGRQGAAGLGSAQAPALTLRRPVTAPDLDAGVIALPSGGIVRDETGSSDDTSPQSWADDIGPIDPRDTDGTGAASAMRAAALAAGPCSDEEEGVRTGGD